MTTAASTLSVITKSTTSKEYTTTKGGAKGDKTEQSEEKGKKPLCHPMKILDFYHTL